MQEALLLPFGRQPLFDLLSGGGRGRGKRAATPSLKTIQLPPQAVCLLVGIFEPAFRQLARKRRWANVAGASERKGAEREIGGNYCVG